MYSTIVLNLMHIFIYIADVYEVYAEHSVKILVERNST